MIPSYRPFQPTLSRAGLRQLGLRMKRLGPCETLAGTVHSYLQIEAGSHSLYPVMPDGTQAIYMSMDGVFVGGARTKPGKLALMRPGSYFGIWFYPGALRHFFHLNLAEITDQLAERNYLGNIGLGELREAIYCRATFLERAELCENWFLRRYAPAQVPGLEQALSLIFRTSGTMRVAQIANRVGWSTRHLNRRLLQYTGLGTKAFCQIIRVQALARRLSLVKPRDFLLNEDHGYYDQPHLINAFKHYFGVTPEMFRRGLMMSDLYNR